MLYLYIYSNFIQFKQESLTELFLKTKSNNNIKNCKLQYTILKLQHNVCLVKLKSQQKKQYKDKFLSATYLHTTYKIILKNYCKTDIYVVFTLLSNLFH